ncbi:MAG: sulfatase family protein [Aeoliella sp.]
MKPINHQLPQTLLSLFVILLCANALDADEHERTKPNIVVVLADDHAFEAISAYGTYLKDFAKTPAIDRLGREGVRLDNFVCCNSICSPSRASILTGQYSHKNGVRGLGGKINEDSPQYPVELQKAGYQTWLVGKWHLGSKPKGYQKHMVVKGQGKYFNPAFNGTEGTWKREGYSTDVYTDIAMDWLGKRDREKPFLLCLQFKAPHHDYGHAKRYDELLADVTVAEPPTLYEDVGNSDSNLKRDFLALTKFHMLYSGGKRGDGGNYYLRHLNDQAPDAMWEHDANSDKDKIRVAYQHMIHKYIRCATGNDDNLKRVLDYLDAEGIADDTIVIYTSDQGYWLGQHGFYDKRLILETSMRMPFLMRFPRAIQPGTVNHDLYTNVDIAPTLLELAGVPIPKTMQGTSMRSLLKADAPVPERKSQFYTYWGAPPHYGIRTKRYTYLHLKGRPEELFDRRTDPDQSHNIAADPANESLIKRLEKELQKQIKDVDIAPEELPGFANKKTKGK